MIQNLIIAKDSGIPLYARSLMCNMGFRCIDLAKDKLAESTIMIKTALFSAKIIYDEIETNLFHTFELEKTKVLSFVKDDIYALYALEAGTDVEEYKNRLKYTAEVFLENFSSEIENFVGKTSVFQKFDELVIERGLLEEGERFRSNCLNCIYDKACSFRIFTGISEDTLQEKILKQRRSSFLRKAYLTITGMLFSKWYLTPKIRTRS